MPTSIMVWWLHATKDRIAIGVSPTDGQQKVTKNALDICLYEYRSELLSHRLLIVM